MIFNEEALEVIPQIQPDLVIMDIRMGGLNGIETLRKIREFDTKLPVILMTAFGTTQMAIQAMKHGAYDYLLKPFDVPKLEAIVDGALKAARDMKQKVSYEPLLESEDYDLGIIGRSAPMQEVFKTIGQLAGTNATALITGESGTGKELVARAIYHHSDRSEKPFIAVNCAAIPENLLESELFGHEKGAFTGAVKTTPGKIEMAHGGTLFLDEIGDVPLPLQVKLLRFLLERVIERVGGRKAIPVDTRIVCATHQDVDAMVADGRFRDDLYYRLAEIVVPILPLAARTGDALLLAHHFLRHHAAKMERAVTGFTPEARAAITGWGWPGNVRELENRVKRAVIMADDKLVTAADLDLSDAEARAPLNLKTVREAADRKAVRDALSQAEGNISGAARLLGISRPTLYDLMRNHDLQP